MNKTIKISLYSLAALILLYLILLIPTNNKEEFTPANKEAFSWKQTPPIEQYSQFYQKFKNYSPKQLDSTINIYHQIIYKQILFCQTNIIPASHPIWHDIVTTYAAYSALFSISQKKSNKYAIFYSQIRKCIKEQSILWASDAIKTKNTLYKVLYGTRAVYEEVLSNSKLPFPYLNHIQNEASTTPSFQLNGITVHSGDILLSRGSTEVSSLIARINDYPGNFSHAALAYVDKDNTPYIFESHIEVGVTKSTLEEYLTDKKLRILVLRPKSTLPKMIQNPMLPHQAAERMNKEKTSRHIPYDFAMDLTETEKLFCSEVASFAYKEMGIQLWNIPSSISTKGTANWLHTFGVEYFNTQMPSDLEYDPQLSIIAEWCDSTQLQNDRIYNASMDALLLRANKGEKIGYNHWMLPLAYTTSISAVTDVQ